MRVAGFLTALVSLVSLGCGDTSNRGDAVAAAKAEEQHIEQDASATASGYCSAARLVAVDSRRRIDEAFAQRDRNVAVAEAVRSLAQATRSASMSFASSDLRSDGAAEFAAIFDTAMTARADAYDEVAAQIEAISSAEPRFASRVDALVSTAAVTSNDGETIRLPGGAALFWAALGEELRRIDGCSEFADSL